MIQWSENERVLNAFEFKIFLTFKGFYKVKGAFLKWLI